MYLYHFAMKKLPFGLTPDTEFFCPVNTHVEALNVLAFAINSGEALIKIIGEPGTGKTLLCRLLLNQLQNDRKVAYIPCPKLSTRELKFALSKELGLLVSDQCREDQLSQKIQNRLINLNKKSGPVVLIIDEAQVLDGEGLETLRLFTNLETEFQKLLQIVLFGQPELDQLLNRTELRQIKQRIVFSYRLSHLSFSQTNHYVNNRLKVVSSSKIHYSKLTNALVHYYSRGIPRLINVLCHKALMAAYGQGNNAISSANIIRAAKDTESIKTPIQDHTVLVVSSILLVISGSVMAFWGLS